MHFNTANRGVGREDLAPVCRKFQGAGWMEMSSTKTREGVVFSLQVKETTFKKMVSVFFWWFNFVFHVFFPIVFLGVCFFVSMALFHILKYLCYLLEGSSKGIRLGQIPGGFSNCVDMCSILFSIVTCYCMLIRT